MTETTDKKLCNHCYADLHGDCAETDCPCECNAAGSGRRHQGSRVVTGHLSAREAMMLNAQQTHGEWFADVKKTGTLSEFLRSIADAVEALENRPATCLETEPGTDWVCGLRDRHRGQHAATDGTDIHRWMDDE